jgi:hypothetical protein
MNIFADKNLINIDHFKKKKNDFFSLYIAQERSDNYSKIRPVVAFLTTGRNMWSSWHFCVDQFFEQLDFDQLT